MFLGRDGFHWFMGVVEDRNDPVKLGRTRVRIFAQHTDDKSVLPTQDLLWALPSFGTNTVHQNITLKEGDWVWGFFMDHDAQKPVIVGTFPGIPKDAADPTKGFNDPTTDLSPQSRPTPPVMMPVSIPVPSINVTEIRKVIRDLKPPDDLLDSANRCIDIIFEGKNSIPVSELPSAISRIPDAIAELSSEVQDAIKKATSWLAANVAKITSMFSLDKMFDEASKFLDRFSSENTLPGSSSAFGELMKGWDITKSKFDLNKDGQFDLDDVKLMILQALNSAGFYTGKASSVAGRVPPSSYPNVDKLGEPSVSRLARGESPEKTIVGLKKENLAVGLGPGHDAQDSSAQSDAFAFQEPVTPYAALYPYNQVHESESGHVIEVDDTPGAERLHWYHRSGTFTEIHPDGKEVNKVVKEQYNFILSDYFLGVSKSMNVDCLDAIRMKSGKDTNLDIGENLNAEIGTSCHLATGDSVYIYAKGGVVYIKGAKAISLQSEGDVDLVSGKAIHLRAPQIHISGTLHAPNPPYKHASEPANENDADKKSQTTDSSPKPGVLWPEGLPGEVYKPKSDSDGKLVTLSPSPEPHQLFEAIPAGGLEGALIKYENADGSINTWKVVRPIHVPGKLIDVPKIIKPFEDGIRTMQRWSKPGDKYPTVMFLKTGGGLKLILDSSIRHHMKQPFSKSIPIIT